MERKDYKRYSREFKLEAVRLAAVGDRPKAQIARELGIRVNQLRKWAAGFRRRGANGRARASPDLRRRPRPASARERQAQGGERDPKKRRSRRPRPLWIETSSAYTASASGQRPLAFWRHPSPSKNLAQGKLRTQLWWHLV